MTPFLQFISYFLFYFFVSLSFIFNLYYVYLFLLNGVCHEKHQYCYCIQCKCFELNTFSSGNVNAVL